MNTGQRRIDPTPDGTFGFGEPGRTGNERLEEKKSALPHRAWEVAGQRKVIPEDLRDLMGAATDVLRMGQHAWATVSPPPPGTPLAPNRIDAAKGKTGKHYSSRQFVDELDRLTMIWEYQGRSAPNKTPAGESRWEVLITIDEDYVLLVVIAAKASTNEHYLHVAYKIRRENVRTRIEKGYLERRK